MTYQEQSIQMHGIFCKTFYSTTASGKRPKLQHRHVLPEIALVLSGSGIYEVNEKEYRFQEGDVFFFAGNVTHYITQINSDSPFLLFNLQFEGNAFVPENYYMKECLFFPANENIQTSGKESVCPSEIMTHIHNDQVTQALGWKMQLQANLLTLLVGWVRYSSTSEDGPNSVQSNESIMRAISYISEHLTEDLRLSVLAREVGLSRTYFSSVFHATTGMKVWEYITKKRIKLAMQWLVGSDCTITEVALHCGFNHTASFYRLFKRQVGQSPSDFRNASKSNMEKV